MKEYTRTNREAYDLVAEDYNHRWREYIDDQTKVLRRFEKRLRQTFSGHIRVLDAGCGVGLDAFILTNHGFSVTGIDISPRMIAYARRNAPLATFREGDFLALDTADTFHGIVMTAFVHQFPSHDVPLVLEKTRSLLVSKGVGIICTTLSEAPQEGYFTKKEHGTPVKRFRKFWTPGELRTAMTTHGFDVLEYFEDKDSLFEKIWINLVFQSK